MPMPAGSQPPAHSALRIGTALGLPGLLKELGHDPVRVISEAGLDPRMFDNPDNRLPLSARGRLLARCAEVTGRPHFGLLVGEQVSLGSLGLIGLLVRHSHDVGTGLRRLARHFHLHADGVEVGLAVEQDRALVSYSIHEPDVPGVDQAGDGAVAAILNIMRELCGPDFKATEAWFGHPRPANVEPFRSFFQVHLRFDAEIYGLVFSSSWLPRPLPATEPELMKLLQERVEEFEQHHGSDFPEQVQSVMRTALAFDQVTADRLAAMFGMHVRTYHRRLRAHGTSQQELLDRTRFAVACQLLESPTRVLPEISELLGYAEPRSFIRAFRRWSGLTPARWRKERSSMKTARSAPAWRPESIVAIK
jgi:AraC-like DNA-binding protein